MAGGVEATSIAEAWKSTVKGSLIQPVDTLPAYLFGPGRGSRQHGLEIDGAIGVGRSVYRDAVITKEIER